MKKILIAGAGGAPSEGVIRSLLHNRSDESIIGMGSDVSDLVLSKAEKKFYVPYAVDASYEHKLSLLLSQVRPNLIHFQNDQEIFVASKLREMIASHNVNIFMPDHSVIDTCVNKYKSYLVWSKAGLKVPKNIQINTESDLKNAFKELKDQNGKIWIRASSIGGGGKGALPTDDYEFAKCWINRFAGWEDFIAAEMLTNRTVTWLSIWYEGDLVVAQTRLREGWVHGNRTVSGVTGVTKVGKTYSNTKVDDIAHSAILSIDPKPHGIYGVDMTYDYEGIPNPTEINISRFFTTILFFTEAGLNFPVIFKNLALYGEKPVLKRKINPLNDGLMWLRGMDTVPRIMTAAQIENEITFL